MRVLIGISHPKQVYIFKNIIYALERNGHKYFVVVNEKEITSQLLKSFKIKFKKIGTNKSGILNKVIQSLLLTFKTIQVSVKFKPDIYIGQAIPHLAFTSFFFRKPFIIVEDNEIAKRLQQILLPFTDSLLTTSGFKNNLSSKQIRINGNLELLYLHPKWFKRKLVNAPGEKYVLLRFVSWSAFHDIGHHGLSIQAKWKLVNKISDYTRVYISSEDNIPEEFIKYQLKIQPEDIHSFVYNAELVFGESPSMTTESAIIGTPAICVSSWACNSLGNFSELYNDEMIYCYHPNKEEDAINKALELLATNDLKTIWKNKAEKFIDSRIDVTKFMVWFIENYPESHLIMKNNPDYQNRFK